jgi:hypothetical protein
MDMVKRVECLLSKQLLFVVICSAYFMSRLRVVQLSHPNITCASISAMGKKNAKPTLIKFTAAMI